MKRKKRVLSISHYYISDNRGGGEVMLHELLKSLVDRDYAVEAIVTWTEGDTLDIDSVTIYRGKKHLQNVSSKYDLIVSHFHEADKAIELGEKFNVPVVFVAHNTFDNTAKTLSKNPDLVVFNTEWVRKFHNYNGNSIVVHPPVYAEDHRTTHGAKITLVNLIPSKGSVMFYNLSILMKGFQFLGVEGGYYKERQEKRIRDNVEIQSNTDDMKTDVWSKTKILLMPSSYESYGMVGVEAMASGIPVVAMRTPGLEESLSYAGIFPRNNSLPEWIREIKLLHNPEVYEIASNKALKRSKEINPKIELNKFADKVEELIR